MEEDLKSHSSWGFGDLDGSQMLIRGETMNLMLMVALPSPAVGSSHSDTSQKAEPCWHGPCYSQAAAESFSSTCRWSGFELIQDLKGEGSVCWGRLGYLCGQCQRVG